MTADDAQGLKVRWSDFMIDVQGVYAKAEGGEQCVLSYLCTALRLPKVVAFKSLEAGLCSRALVFCVIRARVLPEIVRSDQQEAHMTSRVPSRVPRALCGEAHEE